jgi:ATP-dependent DNA helicase RecQ
MAYGLSDVVQQRRLIEQSDADDAFKRVASAKLDALLGLAESASCRRVRLLDYFGEASAPCGNCDNCLTPPQTWDATDASRRALSAIYRTGQRFGAAYVIDVLCGKTDERVLRWGHERLSVFGIGADLDTTTWRSVFRQLVAQGLVQVDHEAFGALKLAEASRAVLRGEATVAMRRTVARLPRAPKLRGEALALGAAAQSLFERLRAWRGGEARAQGVPAYVILHDRTLAAIAQSEPADLTALARIDGIGTVKLARYGEAIVALVGGVEAPGPV